MKKKRVVWFLWDQKVLLKCEVGINDNDVSQVKVEYVKCGNIYFTFYFKRFLKNNLKVIAFIPSV